MAMRLIRKEAIIQFKPKDGFRVAIPDTFLLDQNVDERAKVMSLWRGFRRSAERICNARYAFLMNKKYRRAVFTTQMEKFCQDFSRRTENLKVVFQVQAVPRRNHRRRRNKKENYQLKFLQLTDIPEYCRNARYCTAEIPPRELQAFGEYVSDRYDSGLGTTGLSFLVEQVSPEGGPSTIVPSAPIEILDDRTTPVPAIYISEDSEEYENLIHPPLASAVVVAVEDDGYSSDEENSLVFATATLA